MPDSLGRYFVYEMEKRVRLLLDAFNQVLDADGNTLNITITDFNVSNQNIDVQLNESLSALYTEAIVAHEDIFAQVVFMDINTGQLEYAFPANMLQLRWMRAK